MTLRAVFNKEKMRSIKDTMPNELVVYKVALLTNKEDRLLNTVTLRYFSPITGPEYLDGEQSNFWDREKFTVPLVDQPEKCADYYPGFHSFTNKTSSTKLLDYMFPGSVESAVLLTCGVLKDWIIAIGIEGDRDLVIVSNRILMPSYPHTDIRNDKNCDWFFEAQSKAKPVDANLKNKIDSAQPEKKEATIYKQNRKHNNTRKGFRER